MINLIKEKENPLFGRKEVNITIFSEVCPNKTEILKMLSEKFSVPIENISVNKIKGKFGTNTFFIDAYLYYSKEYKDTIELKKKEKIVTNNQQKS
ncbi:MAG: hypothetical protein QXX55_02095 [Candidatus Pacearchaeota archaeon]